ncbi:MAG: hypothetical protein ACP5QW_09455 [bacterium]
MKRLIVAISAIVLFSGFIIPAYKMAELLTATGNEDTIVLKGNAFFNLGKDYIDKPVPCTVIIRANGYIKQDYIFPRAHVSIVTIGTNKTVIVNNTRILTPVQLFARNNIFVLLMRLYLSDNPQMVFKEMGVNQSQVAYGLANNRAAYIIGNDNDQLFIDNELTVPIMYRLGSANDYALAVVKSYLTDANLASNKSVIIKDEKSGVSIDNYASINTTLPGTVELYDRGTLVQRWEFKDAIIFNKAASLNSLLLSPYDIRKLPTTTQILSPFMLF